MPPPSFRFCIENLVSLQSLPTSTKSEQNVLCKLSPTKEQAEIIVSMMQVISEELRRHIPSSLHSNLYHLSSIFLFIMNNNYKKDGTSFDGFCRLGCLTYGCSQRPKDDDHDGVLMVDEFTATSSGQVAGFIAPFFTLLQEMLYLLPNQIKLKEKTLSCSFVLPSTFFNDETCTTGCNKFLSSFFSDDEEEDKKIAEIPVILEGPALFTNTVSNGADVIGAVDQPTLIYRILTDESSAGSLQCVDVSKFSLASNSHLLVPIASSAAPLHFKIVNKVRFDKNKKVVVTLSQLPRPQDANTYYFKTRNFFPPLSSCLVASNIEGNAEPQLNPSTLLRLEVLTAGLKQSLEINGDGSVKFNGPKTNDEQLKKVSSPGLIPLIHILEISDCQHLLSSDSFKEIAKLKKLTKVIVQKCDSVDDLCIAELASIEKVWTLILRDCNSVSDAGIQSLFGSSDEQQQMSNLYCLDISRCGNVTDSLLQIVSSAASSANLPKLAYLRFDDCDNITDDGLKFFANSAKINSSKGGGFLPSLKGLHFHKCKKVTEEGRRALLAALPSLDVKISKNF